MRKQQSNRKESLLKLGFTETESDVLKSIPLYVPYLKTMISDRIKLVRLAQKEGWSKLKFYRAINNFYNARNFKNEDERISKSNVYKALRDYESQWRLTVDKNDPYFLSSNRHTHHSLNNPLDRKKLAEQKRKYRETHKEQLQKYRKEHRQQINEARRRRSEFLRNNKIS